MLGWSRRTEVVSSFIWNIFLYFKKVIKNKCSLLFIVVYPSSNYDWRASLLLNLHTTHKCASLFINIEIILNQDGTESYLFESSVDHPPPTGNFFFIFAEKRWCPRVDSSITHMTQSLCVAPCNYRGNYLQLELS